MAIEISGQPMIELISNVGDKSSYTEMNPAASLDRSDVHFFESQLNTKPDVMAENITSGADMLSNSLKQKKASFETALKKASESADSADILAAARSLSEYSIQTSIVAKAAGKSSQAVDKVTSLN